MDSILYWSPLAFAKEAPTNLDFASLGFGGVVTAGTFFFLGLLFTRGDNFDIPVFLGRAPRAKLCALTGILAPCFMFCGPSLTNASALVALAVLIYCNLPELQKASL